MINKSDDKKMQEALIFTNVAFLLADVANGLMIDVEAILEYRCKQVNHGELKEFKKMLNEARALKDRAKKIAEPIYKIREVDSAIEDSDWLLDIILLITDRVGDSQENALRIREILKQEPSALNFYGKE